MITNIWSNTYYKVSITSVGVPASASFASLRVNFLPPLSCPMAGRYHCLPFCSERASQCSAHSFEGPFLAPALLPAGGAVLLPPLLRWAVTETCEIGALSTKRKHMITNIYIYIYIYD